MGEKVSACCLQLDLPEASRECTCGRDIDAVSYSLLEKIHPPKVSTHVPISLVGDGICFFGRFQWDYMVIEKRKEKKKSHLFISLKTHKKIFLKESFLIRQNKAGCKFSRKCTEFYILSCFVWLKSVLFNLLCFLDLFTERRQPALFFSLMSADSHWNLPTSLVLRRRTRHLCWHS